MFTELSFMTTNILCIQSIYIYNILHTVYHIQGSSTSRNGVESGQEVDEPPPYEEAVKYPSISSLLTINTEIGSPIFNDLVSEGSEGRQQVTTSTAMTSTSSTSQDANLTSEAAFTSARQTTTSAFSPHPISQSVQSSDTQRHHLSPTRSLSCGHIHSSSNHPHSSSHHHHSSSRHDDDDDRNPETDVNSPKSATSNQM